MKTNSSESSGNRDLFAIIAFLAGACIAFHLASAAAGHSLYRDIHMGTALQFAKTKIDLFHAIIVGFNATGTPTIQELPLWQAAAAAAFKLFGPWFGWANVVSLVMFFTCLYPLYQLVCLHLGTRCAAWALIFFLAQPLIFIYAGLASPDGFAIMTSIWFWYFATRLLATPSAIWWILSCVFGSLAAVSKLPFFMAAGLATFFLLLRAHRTSLRHWLLLGSAGAVAGVVFLAWTHYTDHCLALAEFPLVDLRLSNPSTFSWFFGDWHYRLSPGNWAKGGWRILNSLFGSFVLVGPVIYALVWAKNSAFAKFSLLGGFVTMLIFSHLTLQHSHYYLMFSPGVAILSAQAMLDFEKNFSLDALPKRLFLGLGVMALLSLSVVQGMIGMKVILHYDDYPDKIVALIERNTQPVDKLLVQGGGWGGYELFLANRQGLSIWNTQFLEKPENLARLKALGYNKLVMISESPLLWALQVINPGQTHQQRETYHHALTPIADQWPTVFQSDDILIKAIP